MSIDFHVVIPARYQSSRLPGKLMLELEGQTVIERVYRQALKAKPKSIIIATDSLEIANHAADFGAQVTMTAASHQTGTDRIAEVVAKGQFAGQDIIVNVQGDEPLIAPELISQVAHSLYYSSNQMASLCWPIESIEQLHNPNIVKVVRDKHNDALYFSRSAIPAHRDDSKSIKQVFRHIGLYAYRAAFLLDFVSWPVCELEACEALEQLRALWAGYKIRIDEACTEPLQDINTQDDLISARNLLREIKIS
ncbi:3-deoxy-manno-octulosonate cytidylyltransferase [Legionella micdadei]|uniref:3-deoxy-manno-octulosonate cytidylyltransferase n=1 Tax=Legionella micdadei TaxID=451 RepID=A0A098GEB6_LEGMI|nr:3-deoxy-manno-octulosonate cytidylyltransferase [Legionella micdadei]ARG98033.1 3-deoxy-manno-octulosonate cytidylyltransferase [Legionella micdadei]ARH00829.1 3-deoxy-manno-octulosonate cytidylyltransferase [Legionella micdadei]KTD30141.1 3-deoxy-manno-octulosonate cytidylyltransferase [Legionella micdadei]NSL18484.1 3-deoxy-manno-octulosonate cytidylyltransferase [Legionella micdadei]CEG60337.1 3-deoxy-manno-octulosonate cytidylyltransferase [Legionella micdadei]